MKLSHWFLLLLLGFGIVIILLINGMIPENAIGMEHPDYKTMSHSGTSVALSEATKWFAYFFGLGIVSIFGFAVTFGARRKGKFSGISKWLIIGILAYLLMFSFLAFSYWDYADDPNSSFFGGLPIPTAIMLYGLGSIPLIFSLVYIFKFKSWVLTDVDEKRFHAIVRRRKQNEKTQ